MKIREIIRNVISEIFDNLNIPDGLQKIKDGDSYIYKFSTDKNSYCVKFKSYKKEFSSYALTFKKDVDDAINRAEDKWFVTWGVCLENNDLNDISVTNAKEEIFVFNSVFAIVNKFVSEHEIDVLFFQAMDKRINIYNLFITKKIKKEFVFEPTAINKYLINKRLFL